MHSPNRLYDSSACSGASAATDCIERVIQVVWSHRLVFTEDVLNPANPALKDILVREPGPEAPRALFVFDESLAGARPELPEQISDYCRAHRQALNLICRPLICEGGEQAKNSWTEVARLHAAINEHHIDRHSYLIAIGGGALLDTAGLAAATAHRGVRHIRLPTTVLSQCDSGVGVKNGVNAFGKKNFIGTFAPPAAVINDFNFLDTLPVKHKRAGYSEAVKVACIRDAAFFDALERDAESLRQFEPEAMRHLIRRCAELHINHIAEGGDPFEFGSARPLDFGHWSAHKLEQLSGFRISHGNAVAIGLALDTLYSRRMHYLSSAGAERVLRLLESLDFELFAPEMLWSDPRGELLLLQGLEEFREHLGGRLVLTLLRKIGTGFEVDRVCVSEMIASLRELQARQVARASRPRQAAA